MPRKIVPLVTGEIYHVYNRGVDKRQTFESESDYIRFYYSLEQFNTAEPVGSLRNSSKNNLKKDQLVTILAYALLPNHFHILLKQSVDGGISEFLKRVQCGYAGHFNQSNQRSGALFQGKFQRVHVDTDEYFNYLFSYINENHSVHNVGIERKIFHSSSLHYQGIVKSKLLSNNEVDTKYDLKAALNLAKDIYKRRTDLKQYLFE